MYNDQEKFAEELTNYSTKKELINYISQTALYSRPDKPTFAVLTTDWLTSHRLRRLVYPWRETLNPATPRAVSENPQNWRAIGTVENPLEYPDLLAPLDQKFRHMTFIYSLLCIFILEMLCSAIGKRCCFYYVLGKCLLCSRFVVLLPFRNEAVHELLLRPSPFTRLSRS